MLRTWHFLERFSILGLLDLIIDLKDERYLLGLDGAFSFFVLKEILKPFIFTSRLNSQSFELCFNARNIIINIIVGTNNINISIITSNTTPLSREPKSMIWCESLTQRAQRAEFHLKINSPRWLNVSQTTMPISWLLWSNYIMLSMNFLLLIILIIAHLKNPIWAK